MCVESLEFRVPNFEGAGREKNVDVEKRKKSAGGRGSERWIAAPTSMEARYSQELD